MPGPTPAARRRSWPSSSTGWWPVPWTIPGRCGSGCGWRAVPRRRSRSCMRFPFTGVIPVDKPVGVSSRHVVDVVARALRMKAVGHAGTLDPLAGGVVIVCVGHATKLVDYLHELPKTYAATFLLGRSSPSDDLETTAVVEPEPVRPSAAAIESAAGAFRGDILQRPCDYSAAHVDGKRAYALARKGRQVDLKAKPVRIDRLEITAYEWPRLGLEIECSSGTYVRAIGRDLAAALGTTAVMESLVRTAVGPFSLADALPLAGIGPDAARAALRPPLAAVAHLPRFDLSGERLAFAVRGGLVDCGIASAAAAACDETGALVGILQRHATGRHRLRPNFHGAG
ncbi:MAG: tRNA pseudouridine(55) synthase TruB [Planctomycetia bacterium]|nr:tRNA pseudouridine(55) synthase TruB [Planctomycetia bacterium]